MHADPVKVLLVDDDEDDYIITRDLINRITGHRYQIEWAGSYEAGLAAAGRQEHDIYLVDYRLGAQTGLDLLRETRSADARAPMILLTGQGDREVDVEAMKAGAADYLIKGQLSPDILERAIRYAIERRQAEESVRRERDLISRIMETSPVGILTLDRSGKITFANTLAEQLLGLAREVVQAGTCHIRDCRFINPEAKSPRFLAEPVEHVLLSGKPVQDARFALERGDQHIALSLNATALRNASSLVDGLVVTVEDITERLNLESQLRQSQKMESVGQLAAGVAHDINNVLTIIMGHVGLLMNTSPPQSPSVKSLWQISAAAERAARFVRQLLLFSRRQVIQSKALELNSVLRNLTGLLPRLLGEDVVLETVLADELPRVEADIGMLEQVVMNLAVNARDAMSKGGKLRLATSVADVDAAHARQHGACAGRFVCLTVTDTGTGMDQRVQAHLFEPFFSTKEPGRGTGLGLATVYGIVKQHRGWIEVESEAGVGSVFRIYLPPSAKAAHEDRDTPVVPGTVLGGDETILLVEDEAVLRELLSTVLVEYGYRVIEASSGAEALRIWKTNVAEVDLLLTDIVMPGGTNGYELAKQLLQHRPDLRVLFTSGYSAEMMNGEAARQGSAFLPKPYVPRQIVQLVRQCLDAAPNTQGHAAFFPETRPCVAA